MKLSLFTAFSESKSHLHTWTRSKSQEITTSVQWSSKNTEKRWMQTRRHSSRSYSQRQRTRHRTRSSRSAEAQMLNNGVKTDFQSTWSLEIGSSTASLSRRNESYSTLRTCSRTIASTSKCYKQLHLIKCTLNSMPTHLASMDSDLPRSRVASLSRTKLLKTACQRLVSRSTKQATCSVRHGWPDSITMSACWTSRLQTRHSRRWALKEQQSAHLSSTGRTIYASSWTHQASSSSTTS